MEEIARDVYLRLGKGEKTFSGSDVSDFAIASTSVGDYLLVWFLRYYK